MSVRTPLVHPARYFRKEDRRVRGKHILGLFVAILFLDFTLVGLVTNWWTGEYPWGILLFSLFVLLPVIFGVAYTIYWMSMAAVMHYLTGGARPEGSHRQSFKDYLTGGNSTEGSYGKALDVVGWAFAPKVLLEVLVVLPLILYDLSQARAPTISEMLANAEQHQGGFIEMFAGFMQLTVVIWFGYILTYGVATTHDVSPRRAFIPAFLIFLFQIRNLVPPL